MHNTTNKPFIELWKQQEITVTEYLTLRQPSLLAIEVTGDENLKRILELVKQTLPGHEVIEESEAPVCVIENKQGILINPSKAGVFLSNVMLRVTTLSYISLVRDIQSPSGVRLSWS